MSLNVQQYLVKFYIRKVHNNRCYFPPTNSAVANWNISTIHSNTHITISNAQHYHCSKTGRLYMYNNASKDTESLTSSIKVYYKLASRFCSQNGQQTTGIWNKYPKILQLSHTKYFLYTERASSILGSWLTKASFDVTYFDTVNSVQAASSPHNGPFFTDN